MLTENGKGKGKDMQVMWEESFEVNWERETENGDIWLMNLTIASSSLSLFLLTHTLILLHLFISHPSFIHLFFSIYLILGSI